MATRTEIESVLYLRDRQAITPAIPRAKVPPVGLLIGVGAHCRLVLKPVGAAGAVPPEGGPLTRSRVGRTCTLCLVCIRHAPLLLRLLHVAVGLPLRFCLSAVCVEGLEPPIS